MEAWMKTSLILCVFGFLKEFRPSDPFFTQYLVNPTLNLTEVQANQQIYPVITYSQLSLLVLVFLLTDLLRYKPVIIIGGMSIIVSTVFAAISQQVLGMQMMSFFYGIFLATEVAYFTYIYAKVDRKHYQKVTSYTQTALLLGRFTSSALGQILLSTESTGYKPLIYITLGACTLATIWAFFLPPADRSIYFHAPEIQPNTTETLDKTSVPHTTSPTLPPAVYSVDIVLPTAKRKQLRVTRIWLKAYQHLWSDFKDGFSNLYVLKWSVWWALASCGYFQVYLYAQVFWESINSDKVKMGQEPQTSYNGSVDAIYTITGAAAAFACGWLRLNWQVLGEATLAACALLQGAALVVASLTADLYTAYVATVIFWVLYHAMITIVNAEIAKHINEDSYGLIFGVNTFFALVIQTVLTVAVAGEGGFALSARTQFLTYGCCFVALGAIFAVMAAATLCGGKLKHQPLWLPKDIASPKL